MSFELLDPFEGMQSADFAPAPRLGDLRGVRLGLLDNSKTNAAKFLQMVADLLIRDVGVGEVKMFRKEALSKPAPEDVLAAVAHFSQVAVTGIGDCGSCSTNSVHDAIELEKLGIPTIAICTEAFLPGLDALSKMRGMPRYRFALVPHPLGVLFDDELLGRAQLAAPQVAAIATGQAA